MSRLTPSDPKSTVITELRPLSWVSKTVPRPYLSWVILSPTLKSEMFKPLSLPTCDVPDAALFLCETAEVCRVVTFPERPEPDDEP